MGWLDDRRTTEHGTDYQVDGFGNVELFVGGGYYGEDVSVELTEQELVEMLDRLRRHNADYRKETEASG